MFVLLLVRTVLLLQWVNRSQGPFDPAPQAWMLMADEKSVTTYDQGTNVQMLSRLNKTTEGDSSIESSGNPRVSPIAAGPDVHNRDSMHFQ